MAPVWHFSFPRCCLPALEWALCPARSRQWRSRGLSAVMQALPYAQQLGVRCVNVLAGRQPEEGDLLHCLHTLAGNARYAAEAFQSIGVTTTLEAINTIDMPGFLVSNIAQMQEILEAADHPTLKMQFDCYHMAMMGEDVLQGLQENIQAIGHIQFADCPGRHEPDTAQIMYANIFEWLQHSSYDGFIAAEYRPKTVSTQSFAWKAKYFAAHPQS